MSVESIIGAYPLAFFASAAAGASGQPNVRDTGITAHPVASVIEHFRDSDYDFGGDREVRVDWQESDFDQPAAVILRIASTGNGLVARQGPRGAELHIRGEAEIEAVRYALRKLLDELDGMDGTHAPTDDAGPSDVGAQDVFTIRLDRGDPDHTDANATSEHIDCPACNRGDPLPTPGSQRSSARYGSPSFAAAAF